MNQKTYKKITSLYRDGLAKERIIRMLIELSKNSDEASELILDFLDSIPQLSYDLGERVTK